MTRVIIFAKAPIAGAAKTRLIPRLGPHGAAALHAAMVERTVAMACAARVGPIELACTPDTLHPLFASIAREYGITLVDQGPGDLGERMRRALERGVRELGAAMAIGTDCPALDARYLQAAGAALDMGVPVVIGPAEDGGYVLIGLRTDYAELFQGIAWGTDTVLPATRSVLRARGTTCHELATLWDVDRPHDLDRLRIDYPELAAPVVIASSAEKIDLSQPTL